MRQYLALLRLVRDHGVRKPTRARLADSVDGSLSRARAATTGAELDAFAIFGAQARFDLQAGFPLLTTKRLPFRIIVEELLWMLRGDTNIRSLLEQGVHIWSEWPHQKYVQETGDAISLVEFERRILNSETFAANWGDLGPVYGKQWCAWNGHLHQIWRVVQDIKAVRDNLRAACARRLVVSAWNVSDIGEMALPPCHTLFQFDVTGEKLSCHLFMRSADVFLGVPFNIASYALLTHLLARETALQVGELIVSFSDLHLYENHVEQADMQLQREPRVLPKLVIVPAAPGLFSIKAEHLLLLGYTPHAHISGEVAV